MYSYFSSRDPSLRSQADALSSASSCPINPAVFVPTKGAPCFDCAQHSVARGLSGAACGLSAVETHYDCQVFGCRVNSSLNLCDGVLHDRYRLLKPLAEGAFGKTFLALDEQAPDSFCVIKQLFLPSHHSHEQRSSALFQQEAQRLAALGEHPQIPQLLDAFEQDGQSFIVQEWIDGWTLEQEVTGTVPFHEAEVWQLLRDLLPVLQYLHDRQIIHRDIKPANIIRRRSSGGSQPTTHQLVLVDFGAAKVGDARDSTETMIGSAEYAAPEQICGQAVFASDLYSLGLTCLYLLTQMSPFDLYDMGDATWKWQAYLAQSISPSLKQILCTLLQPAVRRRYQSAAEVLAAIDTFCLQAHKQSKQIASTIAPTLLVPTPLAKAEYSCPTSQCAVETDFSPAAIAAINTIQKTRSIGATIYSPKTQRWHHFRSETAITTPDGWEERSPLFYTPAQRRQTRIGWRLCAVGIGTAVGSVAVTFLWLCVSIIFLALAMPPHSSASLQKPIPQRSFDKF